MGSNLKTKWNEVLSHGRNPSKYLVMLRRFPNFRKVRIQVIYFGLSVRAEQKFKNAFSCKPWAVPVFSTNKLWPSADDTDGYLRRWVIIPFPRKLDRSKGFDESTLHAETAGVLTKALAYLRVLVGRGKFAPAGAALEVMDEFRTRNEPVRLWLKDTKSVYLDHKNTRITREDAYSLSQWWLNGNGYRVASLGEICNSIRREGFQEQNANG